MNWRNWRSIRWAIFLAFAGAFAVVMAVLFLEGLWLLAIYILFR